MSNIFISYSRQNEEAARRVVADLERLGHAVWIDERLTGSQVWWDQILAQILDCEIFVFALDSASLTSTACIREYEYAAELGKPILPIRVSDDVSPDLLPKSLLEIQFVDYRKGIAGAGIELASALAKVRNPAPLPDPLPPPPEVPISYIGGLSQRVDSPALTIEEQSMLVVDLKDALRDSEKADDARLLLVKLRKRQDALFARVEKEIDEALGATSKEIRNEKSIPPPLTKYYWLRLVAFVGTLSVLVVGSWTIWKGNTESSYLGIEQFNIESVGVPQSLCAPVVQEFVKNNDVPATSIYPILNAQRGAGCILGPEDTTPINERYQTLQNHSPIPAKAVAWRQLFSLSVNQFSGHSSSFCPAQDTAECMIGRHLHRVRELQAALQSDEFDQTDPIFDPDHWFVSHNGTISGSDIDLRAYLAQECLIDVTDTQCHAAIRLSANFIRTSRAMTAVIFYCLSQEESRSVSDPPGTLINSCGPSNNRGLGL